MYSDNMNAFINMANSDGDNETGISFSTASDTGYSSVDVVNTDNQSNSNQSPVRHQSETYSESEFEFSDAQLMHSNDAVYEETTDTESMTDSIICNGGKDSGEGKKRKNGNIAARFEIAPLLNNTDEIV